MRSSTRSIWTRRDTARTVMVPEPLGQHGEGIVRLPQIKAFGHCWLLLRTNPQLCCVKHDGRRSRLAAVPHRHVQLILTATDLSDI